MKRQVESQLAVESYCEAALALGEKHISAIMCGGEAVAKEVA